MRPGFDYGDGKRYDGTLAGNKKDIYLTMKIFKLIFGVSITSFFLKFAIDRTLTDGKYEDMDLGTLLKQALRYHTVCGKFVGVHPELKEIGVKKIEIDYEKKCVIFMFTD